MSNNIVIQCGSVQALIWSADPESLPTRRVVPGETVLLPNPNVDLLTHFGLIPMPNRSSNLHGRHRTRTTVTVHPSLFHNNNDDNDSVLCDILFDDSHIPSDTHTRLERQIRGYRYRLRPVRQPEQGGGYTAEFCLEARFDLPPNDTLYNPDGGHLPGRRGSGLIYGSTVMVETTRVVIQGFYPVGSYLLYSLPNRLEDANNSTSHSTATQHGAEGPNGNAQLLDVPVVPARLTYVWTGRLGRSRQMCMASGRCFIIEGPDPNPPCRVYDFLSPWNHADRV
jgi:hypothetical protein